MPTFISFGEEYVHILHINTYRLFLIDALCTMDTNTCNIYEEKIKFLIDVLIFATTTIIMAQKVEEYNHTLEVETSK